MEGPLSKWTNVMQGWQYRWFVLDASTSLLSYYTSKDKMKRGSRRGCVRLQTAILGIDDEDESTFTITTKEQKTFHFQARDGEERQKWTDALQDAITNSSSQLEKVIMKGKKTSASFDRKLAETDAYLQLLIDQVESLTTRIEACSEESDKEKYYVIKLAAESMIEAVKKAIVMMQLAKPRPVSDDEDDGSVTYLELSTSRRTSRSKSLPGPSLTPQIITLDVDDGLEDVVADLSNLGVNGTPCLILDPERESFHGQSYSSSDDDFYDADDMPSTRLGYSADSCSPTQHLSERGSVPPGTVTTPSLHSSSARTQSDPSSNLGSFSIPSARTRTAHDDERAKTPTMDSIAGASTHTPNMDSIAGASTHTPNMDSIAGASTHTPTMDSIAGASTHTPNMDSIAGASTHAPNQMSVDESNQTEYSKLKPDTHSSCDKPTTNGTKPEISEVVKKYSSEYDFYDRLYEEDAEEELCSLDAHGSIIKHLLSQIRIGMDLTKIVLPTFILERRSLLEMFADFFSHPDLFVRIGDYSTPEERITEVVRWYLSAFHAGRKSSVAKKPYNPILGEIFQCYWDLPGVNYSDKASSNDGPVQWASKDNLCCICEQVSHHPPISAFYAECQNKKISLDGYIWTKSKFLGLSIGVHMVGQAVISLLDHDEEYTMTFPSGYGRSILTVPWVELGGSCKVNCEKTGYHATIDFLTKPFYGGKKDKIKGQIYAPRNSHKPTCTITGEWNGLMFAEYSSGRSEVFCDTKKMPIVKKQLKPIKQQDAMESRRLWKEVTFRLKERDVLEATKFKQALEQKQREEAKERLATGARVINKYFREVGEHWVYTNPLCKRLKTSADNDTPIY